jgi:CheY-like chemotaxis protein
VATILVVDDDPEVNEMTGWTLASLGYSVVSATNATDALAILQNGPAIDLLLTDVVMPGMDGITLTRRVKDICPAMPVVVVSGHVAGLQLPDMSDAVFLRKPYRSKALIEAIDGLLSSSSRQPGT